MKKSVIALLILLTVFIFSGCRTQIGEWFLMDDMNEVNQPPPSKGCGIIIGLKKHYYGEPHKINGVVVSNHLSYMDIVTISNIFNIRFSPNTGIAKWPVLGQFLGLSRPIWVDRNSRQGAKKTLKDFIDTVKHDISIIVFPEGKISDCKEGLQEFKSTVFEVATKDDVPVLPILLHYHDIEICWTKWSLMKHVWNVLKKKRIDVDIHFLTPVYADGLNRKDLSDKVRKVMNEKYGSIYCS